MPTIISEDLETKRLRIRQLTQEDLKFLVSNLNGDIVSSGFKLIHIFEKSDIILFSILLRESYQILGFVALQILEEKEQMECYYKLLTQYTGNGYAIEAMKKIFGYIFGNLQFEKIVAYIDQGNARGWRVAERSGMKYMGDSVRNGATSRSMYFLITKSDYFNQFQF